MPDVTMKVRDVFGAREIVSTYLILLVPLPASQDGGAAARVGMILRRIRRELTGRVEDAQEQQARGGDEAVTLDTLVTLSVPELLTKEAWDAVPVSAVHVITEVDKERRSSIREIVLRKTFADLDTLGPLVVDADELGGTP